MKDEQAGLDMPVVTVGNFSSPREKRTILLTFGEHGRELITSEIALWLVKVAMLLCGRSMGYEP